MGKSGIDKPMVANFDSELSGLFEFTPGRAVCILNDGLRLHEAVRADLLG